MQLHRFLIASVVVLVTAGCDQSAGTRTGSTESSSPKPATEATKAANATLEAALPFSDQRDFENAKRGFIAAIEGGKIHNSEGRAVWDLGRDLRTRGGHTSFPGRPACFTSGRIIFPRNFFTL